MLLIRQEQMRILTAPLFEQFVRQGIDHIHKHFADQFASLGEASVRAAVLHAVERAESHGFSRDADVLVYLTLMFVFGRDFDRDPRFPWASKALAEPRKSAAFRMSRLKTLALSHQDEGRGLVPRGDA
jgi:hypothetical protein